MSNSRRLRAPRHSLAPRCAVCGRGAGGAPVTLADRRVVCGRCVDTGVLAQRLACGHYGMPGTLVITDGGPGNFQCARCSPHSPYPSQVRIPA